MDLQRHLVLRNAQTHVEPTYSPRSYLLVSMSSSGASFLGCNRHKRPTVTAVVGIAFSLQILCARSCAQATVAESPSYYITHRPHCQVPGTRYHGLHARSSQRYHGHDSSSAHQRSSPFLCANANRLFGTCQLRARKHRHDPLLDPWGSSINTSAVRGRCVPRCAARTFPLALLAGHAFFFPSRSSRMHRLFVLCPSGRADGPGTP